MSGWGHICLNWTPHVRVKGNWTPHVRVKKGKLEKLNIIEIGN